MSEKTIIACRPGMKQQMEAAFQGMKIVVDDGLTKDYEFRKEAMTFDEILEAEIEKEERQDADPKNALTFVVPLATRTSEYDDGGIFDVPFLAVRVENTASEIGVTSAIRALKPSLSGTFPDERVNVSATISSLKAHLKKEGFNVLSISQAGGLVSLDL